MGFTKEKCMLNCQVHKMVCVVNYNDMKGAQRGVRGEGKKKRRV